MRLYLLLLCLIPQPACDPVTGRGRTRADGRLIQLLDGEMAGADQANSTGGPELGPPRPADSFTKDQSLTSKPDLSGPTLSAAEKDLLDAVNAARAKKGLTLLSVDPQLLCAARLAAKVVPPTGSCGHVGADGSWPSDRAQQCGMSGQAAWKVNEIAAGPGFSDGADAVWGWSQSSGHWWGLTHPQATRIGVAATSSGCYWAVFDCCIMGS